MKASLAGRYASALFDLARDERQIDSVLQSLERLRVALAESRDLQSLVNSPMVSRTDAARALAAAAPGLGLDQITANFVAVLARNGRLRQLGDIIRDFMTLVATHRGETTAEVVSARPLDDEQIAALKAQLGARVGRTIRIDASVDPSILGGIVVRLGSQMIDASIRTKLNTLATAMKG
jgi:F-type H+-transporting ATPase subunit delta